MATLDTRVYSANFSGLTSTAVTCIAFLTVGLSLEGILKRLRRYPDEDAARKEGKSIPELQGRHDRGMEDWAMGYLYRARSYVPHQPTPNYSSTPFKWIWDSMWMPQRFFEEHVGEDATVYVRFVRACFYWTLLMAFTLFPIIIGVNFVYSSSTYSSATIERASTAALVNTPQESGRLWVHTVCIWFASVTWYLATGWIGYGAVRARRNIVRKLVRRRLPAGEAAVWLSKPRSKKKKSKQATIEYDNEPYANVQGGKAQGWQQRTILLRNVPESMRSERGVTDYFVKYLRPTAADESQRPEDHFVKKHFNRHARTRVPKPPTASTEKDAPLIENIILVRKQAELNTLYIKYKEQLGLLETAQCQVASNVRDHVKALLKQRQHPEKAQTRKFWQKKKPEPTEEERGADEQLVAACTPFVDGSDSRPSEQYWETLNSLEPRLLDRFQPLIKLKHFRGQKVPAVDYHLTKLNLLATLIEKKRDEFEKDETTGTAFVTFASVEDALFVRRYLPSRPGGIKYAGRTFECIVTPAPEFRDLDWNKLVKVSLTSDLVRGLILQTLIWVVTLIWVLPLSFIVGLLSLNQLQNYLPGVAAWIRRNPVLLSVFSNLLPSAIVALISMFVPTVIGILTRNGQTFVTETRWQLATQARYWKWLMVNLVIVFSIGLSAFTAFLNAFRSPASILTVVATSFPKAATFFSSWALLVIGIHHGIQICLFGIPFINHASIRKMRAPRKREFEAQPRFFSYHYWVPNHLLVLAVTILFAVLNPLVIPFAMVYFSFAVVVFKNQLAHVYWRRQFENGGKLVFRRIFRYSLDAFLVAQVTAMAFMFVQKLARFGGAIIPLLPITVIIKLGGTRLFDRLMGEIDEAEARVLCGLPIPDNMSVEIVPPDDDWHSLPLRYHVVAFGDFVIKTLPALVFKRHKILPRVRTASSLAWHASHSASTSSAGKERISMNDSRAVLRPTRSSESTSLTSLEETLPNVKPMAENATAGPITTSVAASDSIVRPHPPVLRDDRPVTNVAYDNPAFVAPLAQCLWLPRNPLKPLDLGDTIDYHGRIFVSSEGGDSRLGKWEELPDFIVEKEKLQAGDDAVAQPSSPVIRRVTSHVSSAIPFDGTETIRVASDVPGRPGIGREASQQSGVSVVVTPSQYQPQRADTGATESTGPGGLSPIDVNAANDLARRDSVSPPGSSPGSRIRRLSSRLSGQRSPSFSLASGPGSPGSGGRRESTTISQSLALQAELIREHMEDIEKLDQQAARERRESAGHRPSWLKRTIMRTLEDESET